MKKKLMGRWKCPHIVEVTSSRSRHKMSPSDYSQCDYDRNIYEQLPDGDIRFLGKSSHPRQDLGHLIEQTKQAEISENFRIRYEIIFGSNLSVILEKASAAVKSGSSQECENLGNELRARVRYILD